MSAFDDDFAAAAVGQLMPALGTADQTYTPAGGVGVTVRAIVGAERSEVIQRPGGEIKRRTRLVTIVSDPGSTYGGVADAALGATMTIDGVTWGIDEIDNSTESVVTLKLIRAETKEVSGEAYRHRS